MLVKVTEEDIKKGIRSTSACPVALAVKRCFNLTEPWYKRIFGVGDYLVSVGTGCVYVDNLRKGFSKVYGLPERATNFVIDFDSGHPVKPFEFLL